MPSYLKAEISYEPMYSEMNVHLEDNSTFKGVIKNIGPQDLNVSCFAAGINHIAIGLNPRDLQIRKGNKKLIYIFINTTEAIPGNYTGLIYICNKDSNETLEEIPIIIKVKNSAKMNRILCYDIDSLPYNGIYMIIQAKPVPLIGTLNATNATRG